MGRLENKRMGKETIEISKNGFYSVNEEKYEFYMEPTYYEEVMVISPEQIEDIKDDEEEFFEKCFSKYSACEYRTVNMDSYEANYFYAQTDRALVMNFANAHHPGGGFLSGASGQEESLCRCSTLFASINSKKAHEMYKYNNEEPDPYDSDYMLISPYVEVFRKVNGEFFKYHFTTAVLTIPAPNLNGMASSVDREQLKFVIKEKIRSFMLVAAKYDYETLILGAWGCGAFGHDAKDVAMYFKDIIQEEEFYQFFKKIIFAVYDKTPDKYNYQQFIEVFGEHGMWKDEGNEEAIINVDYRTGTRDDNNNMLFFEEAKVDSMKELEEVLDLYIKDERVCKIEIVK